MAIKSEEKLKAYSKLESMVMERIFTLEAENSQLKSELALAQAKLSVYERIASISDDKKTLGFGPPIRQEGGNMI